MRVVNVVKYVGFKFQIRLLAVKKCLSGLRESVWQKIKKFFENHTIDCSRTAHQNWPKIIYSLTYSTSQVYIHTENVA